MKRGDRVWILGEVPHRLYLPDPANLRDYTNSKNTLHLRTWRSFATNELKLTTSFMRVHNNDRVDAREKRTSKTQKKRACFLTRERQNNELRTLQTRENSFEHDYYVLSNELRQNQLAETNARTLVMGLSFANCRRKRNKIARRRFHFSYNIKP